MPLRLPTASLVIAVALATAGGGALIILHFMEGYPVIVTLGAGLLGYVAGGMIVSDVAVKEFALAQVPGVKYLAGATGATFVVGCGLWLARRKRPREYPLV